MTDPKTGLSWLPPENWTTQPPPFDSNFGLFTTRVGPTGDTSRPDSSDTLVSWSIPARARSVLGDPTAENLNAYAKDIADNLVQFDTNAAAKASDITTEPATVSGVPAVRVHFRQDLRPYLAWMSGVVTISHGGVVALVGSTRVEGNVPVLDSVVATACVVP